jgi:hypothetical protein
MMIIVSGQGSEPETIRIRSRVYQIDWNLRSHCCDMVEIADVSENQIYDFTEVGRV